jgi:hypothetical protein
VPFHARPRHSPLVRVAGVLRGASSSGRAPISNRKLKYSCGIFLSGLVFENKATVGCVARLTLKGVLSIAVEFERALLTANQLRNSILKLSCFSCKLNPRSFGGIS